MPHRPSRHSLNLPEEVGHRLERPSFDEENMQAATDYVALVGSDAGRGKSGTIKETAGRKKPRDFSWIGLKR